MVTLAPDHPWRVVAPWYHWDLQAGRAGAAGRGTRPVFQMFDRPDFVDAFLRDPQHSLKFGTVDQVWTTSPKNPPRPPAAFPFAGKSVTTYAPAGSAAIQLDLVPLEVTKLFLATHRRYYAVVCEIHCDVPGFPSATLEVPCQAGFVVRRRSLRIPSGARGEAGEILKTIVAAQAGIADLDQTSPLKVALARKRAARVQVLVERGQFLSAREALVEQLFEGRRRLQTWGAVNGVVALHEGWFPTVVDRVGAWQNVEEEPADVTEAWFPMYRLNADPNVKDHDAAGRAIYFGPVPVSSLETDAGGRPRFDDTSRYEVRCFVRRHRLPCPRTVDAPDCKGPVFWSPPTESYQIASQFDLEGTANRPITIQLPDLPTLAAQAANLPFGKASPVRFVQPQVLKPIMAGPILAGGNVETRAVCFMSIPLITIIATFVLNLFLPIVVLIFNLWFLLSFKFCIPPKISFGVDLKNQLKAILPLPNVDADFNVFVPEMSANVAAVDVHAELKLGLGNAIEATTGSPTAEVQGKLDAFSISPLVEMKKSFDGVAALPAVEDETMGLDLGVEFETRVEHPVGVA